MTRGFLKVAWSSCARTALCSEGYCCAPWTRCNSWQSVMHTAPRCCVTRLHPLFQDHLGIGRSLAEWRRGLAAVRGHRKRGRKEGVCAQSKAKVPQGTNTVHTDMCLCDRALARMCSTNTVQLDKARPRATCALQPGYCVHSLQDVLPLHCVHVQLSAPKDALHDAVPRLLRRLLAHTGYHPGAM